MDKYGEYKGTAGATWDLYVSIGGQSEEKHENSVYLRWLCLFEVALSIQGVSRSPYMLN